MSWRTAHLPYWMSLLSPLGFADTDLGCGTKRASYVEVNDDVLAKLDNDHRKLRLLTWLLDAPEVREPATMEQLAEEDGMPSSRTLRSWKRDDAFVKLWRSQSYDVVGSPEETQRVLEALKTTALDRQHRQHVAAANSYLKAVGGMTPPDEALVKQESILEQMSLAELEELAVGMFGKRLEQLGVPSGAE